MRPLRGAPSPRVARLAAAGVLLAGGITGSVLASAGTALAIACGSAEPAGTPCTLTGTVTVTAGTLQLTSASSLTWSATLNGQDQQIVDTVSGDQQYIVSDGTGSGTGWHVTTSATQFTTGSLTLANAGTFSTNGSVSSQSSSSAPTASCGSGSTCTLPTDTTTYPVAITTAASSPTAVTIYDTSAPTGLGTINIGGSAQPHPVGWWISLPATARAGTFTSTITMQIISGP